MTVYFILLLYTDMLMAQLNFGMHLHVSSSFFFFFLTYLTSFTQSDLIVQVQECMSALTFIFCFCANVLIMQQN